VGVTDSSSYAANIQDIIGRIQDAGVSYQALQPTPTTPINQSSLESFVSTEASVIGDIQQLSSFDAANPQVAHLQFTGSTPEAQPISNATGSFWSLLPSALGDYMAKASQRESEKVAFTGPSFDPNDPAISAVMAWAANHPDIAACPLEDQNCRLAIWPYYAASPDTGFLVATAQTAASEGISEFTGIATMGTGDLISAQPDLTPLEQWALTKDINAGIQYFVDNFITPWGRKMVLFGTVSSGQTTALPNGTHNIILASGTSQTQPTGFPVPTITTLAPSSLVAGAAPQTLTINGTNLLSSSTVTFNGVPHSPTYVNSSQLTIPLTSGDLAAAGSFPVVVANPGAIGTLSTAATFWVTTGATTGTVPVGSHPLALAVNPQTNKIYVTNYGSNSVTVIDGNDNSTATIALPYAPWALAVNAVTNKVYVSGGTEVTVIDGATNNTTSIPLAAAATNGGLYGIAVNALTNTIYVVDYYDDTTVINGSDFSSTTLTNLGGPGFFYPFVVVNPTANQIYVPNITPGGGVGSVTIIDGSTLGKITVTVGKNPAAIAVDPITNQIYVANYWSGDVTIINSGDYSTNTIPGGGYAIDIAVNPISNMVYVADRAGCDTYCPGGITIINPTGSSMSSTIAGSSMIAVEVNPSTNKIYFANPSDYPTVGGNNTVLMLDGATNTSTSLTVGNTPAAIAVNPVTNKVYVANSGSNNVTVIGPQ
jgi:YVTN family beta-propeller protein